MAQKKLVKVNFGIAQDLESKLNEGGKFYNQLNQQLGELGKLISVMRTSYKKGGSVAVEVNLLRSKLRNQLKDLGVKESDVPSIARADKFISAYGKLDDEVRKYIYQ
jgi:DNA-directed RNA polymerase subunit H (RpoH/RPB5)